MRQIYVAGIVMKKYFWNVTTTNNGCKNDLFTRTVSAVKVVHLKALVETLLAFGCKIFSKIHGLDKVLVLNEHFYVLGLQVVGLLLVYLDLRNHRRRTKSISRVKKKIFQFQQRSCDRKSEELLRKNFLEVKSKASTMDTKINERLWLLAHIVKCWTLKSQICLQLISCVIHFWVEFKASN